MKARALKSFHRITRIQYDAQLAQKQQIDQINQSVNSNLLSTMKDMEHDTKNKHRISDARWRNSVSKCYNLLKHCSYAKQDSTRQATLRSIFQQIDSFERHIADLGYLEQVRIAFGQGEAMSMQQSPQQ